MAVIRRDAEERRQRQEAEERRDAEVSGHTKVNI